ncbi:MAG: hypothetical protein MK190_01890 [Acidimicrobiales bacterium]|nr:hypothetical protein [Acidimicrobiales bacterium]
MKDSIIRWVAIFALLAVIAVAAIFAIDDDEVTVQAIQDRSQILENETLNSNKKQELFDQDGHLDRSKRGGKHKEGELKMFKPLPPLMRDIDEWHRHSHNHQMPPMMDGFMPPMMRESFMPPMMEEGFEIREYEMFEEIEKIFDSILDLLGSIEELDSVGSEADDGIYQSSELTLSLIQELIEETFDERFEEVISGLVDRVAKDAITQIIEGLDKKITEQSLSG